MWLSNPQNKMSLPSNSQAADADGDGLLDADEFQQLFDLDGDGQVDQAERAKALKMFAMVDKVRGARAIDASMCAWLSVHSSRPFAGWRRPTDCRGAQAARARRGTQVQGAQRVAALLCDLLRGSAWRVAHPLVWLGHCRRAEGCTR